MSKLPRITSRELIRALARAGFAAIRQRGSHVFMQHADGRSTVVPVHRGEDVGVGLLRKILRDTEIEPSEFQKLLKG